MVWNEVVMERSDRIPWLRMDRMDTDCEWETYDCKAAFFKRYLRSLRKIKDVRLNMFTFAFVFFA